MFCETKKHFETGYKPVPTTVKSELVRTPNFLSYKGNRDSSKMKKNLTSFGKRLEDKGIA
ncbi:MAG: hypothetical protein KAI57_03100 [Candidatus Pacebacteria bacterium]|nr:hypothetical protein [Candidatus Paceibacterota bacterium]